MISKKTIVALVLLAAQGAALYFIARSQKRGGASRAIPVIAAKDVRKVVLAKGASTVELVRVDAPGAAAVPDGGKAPEPNWKMTKPVAYAADKANVKTLLERLEKMSVGGAPISKKTEWHDEKFGVGDKTGTKVSLYGEGDALLVEVILGKTEGGRTFLRKPGEDAVYDATGIMAYAFDKKADDWRDKTIFELKEEDVVRLDVKGKELLTLARVQGDLSKWLVESPAGIKLDQGKATGILRGFVGLRAKEFGETAKVAEAGLDKPEAAIVAHTKDGKTHTLLVGKKKGEQDRYVRRADAATIFVVGAWQIDQMNKTPQDVREKEPVIAKPAGTDIQKLTVRGPKGAVTLERGGAKGWRMTSPEAADIDPKHAQDIIAEIQKLNVPEATHGGKEKHAEYELGTRGITVEAFGKDGQKLTAFVVGKEDKGQAFVRKPGDDKVYKTYGLRREVFDNAPDAWKVAPSHRGHDHDKPKMLPGMPPPRRVQMPPMRMPKK